MNKIEFHKSSNIFINTGIVGLHRYLSKYQMQDHSFGNIKNELLPDRLIVENEKILELLEEVYYYMGREVYDTPSKKQIDKNENVYFNEKNGTFSRFPKMNTYGLTALMTNNAQGTTRKKENSEKIKNLEKSKPQLAEKFKGYFSNNNLKLLSKVYLNEPYTKITTLELEEKYWVSGKKVCPITGETFKNLISGINISPFIKGLSTFNSHLESSDRKISQKAAYILRFSPALAMYSYFNGYDSIISTFFNSNHLVNINKLYWNEFFHLKDEMEKWKLPFQRNIKLENFKFSKKDNTEYLIDTGEDSFSPQEINFLILYTFYKRKLVSEIDNENSKIEVDPFENSIYEKIPVSLVSLKADKFASTLRPNFYEEYNNVKFVIRLIHKLETKAEKRVPISEIWRSLIFKTEKTESINDYNKKLKLQRQYRIKIIDKLLTAKSILPDLENVFFKSFLMLSNDSNTGIHRYDILTEFLITYEQAINFRGTIMEQSLQQRAINLGKSIGHAILYFENPNSQNEKRANAKNGRKYLISLHKARTIEQFRDTLIRIQRKFGVSIANEILETLNKHNYIAVKQYALIGALNTLNSVLSNQN